ncbi:hypothetical protein [Bartonella massiliensis]|uniref:hypothetical protein n=1 Tax=Bartonella massiliensis TaxID=929795 RepID=UPI00115B76EF|nr:hypothetical protein [Bartonella massiliensis]
MNVEIDERRFVYILFFVVLSACLLVTVPVIVILREILTSRLKKKIQQLEKATEALQSID